MVLSRVGVVGCGNMGAGIAQKFATEGADVVLVDLDEAAVERGLSRIGALLDEGVARRVYKLEEAESVRRRLHGATEVSALSGTELVIEAVYEDLDVKRDLFLRLDQALPKATLLATNTSSFRVADLQEGMRHPERVLGLHFFYHPAKNRLVEVVGGPATDGHAIARAWHLMEVLGKTPIASKDSSGFVVNRYFVPWLNEAVRLLEDGDGTAGQIDRIARDFFRIGMGPFALMNATGIPIALHAANTLGEAFGAFYAPARSLERLVTSSGAWEIEEPGEDPGPDLRSIVQSRLASAAWLAAGQLVDAGVGAVADVDLGARVGLRWRIGPFELANRVGVRDAVRQVEGLARRWGLEVPRTFGERWDDGRGRPFKVPTVRHHVDAGVGVIELYRPDQLNALSPELLADLESAWEALESSPAAHAIVLRGVGKAFMAGADLKFFADALGRGDLDTILAFSRRAAALYDRIDRSPKRVVAVLDGLSLGGGSELALCADYVVTTDRGSLGFPETGLGIYPGLGGTQRSARRIGRPLARYLVLTGRVVDGPTAYALGLADVVTGRSEAMGAAREICLASDPRSVLPAGAPEPPPWVPSALRLFADGDVEALLDGAAAPGGDPFAEEVRKQLGRKAPLALRLAAGLVDLAAPGADVSRGLAREVEELPRVFASKDAAEGIRAVLERRRPEFTGA